MDDLDILDDLESEFEDNEDLLEPRGVVFPLIVKILLVCFFIGHILGVIALLFYPQNFSMAANMLTESSSGISSQIQIAPPQIAFLPLFLSQLLALPSLFALFQGKRSGMYSYTAVLMIFQSIAVVLYLPFALFLFLSIIGVMVLLLAFNLGNENKIWHRLSPSI